MFLPPAPLEGFMAVSKDSLVVRVVRGKALKLAASSSSIPEAPVSSLDSAEASRCSRTAGANEGVSADLESDAGCNVASPPQSLLVTYRTFTFALCYSCTTPSALGSCELRCRRAHLWKLAGERERGAWRPASV